LDIADAKFKDLLVLPTLELDNGLRLFSPAAIAKYLLVDEGQRRDEVGLPKKTYWPMTPEG